MLEKTPRSGKNVDVTFRMPPLDGVVELYLCGDFNDWHKSGAPLRPQPDGSWAVTLTLELGKSYRFRYFDNQARWHNDWEADAYVPNEFGTEDSVVDLAAPQKNVLPEAPTFTGRQRPARAGAGAKSHPQAKTRRHSSGGPRGGQSGGHSTGGNRPGGHGGHGGNRPHHRPGQGKGRGR